MCVDFKNSCKDNFFRQLRYRQIEFFRNLNVSFAYLTEIKKLVGTKACLELEIQNLILVTMKR